MVPEKSYSIGTPITSAGRAGSFGRFDRETAMWTIGVPGKSCSRCRRTNSSAPSAATTIAPGGRAAYFSLRYVAMVSL